MAAKSWTLQIRSGWWHVIRVVLGLLWLSNALEKLIPHFPRIAHLFNATGNVISLTKYMVQITPFPWFAQLLKASLGLGSVLQVGVGLFELFLALTLLSNRLVRYGALLALPYLIFLELGWVNAEWVFTYPLLFALHLILVLRVWGRAGADAALGGLILRLLSGAIWLYVGLGARDHSMVTAAVGVLLVLGLLTPLAALYGLIVALYLLYINGIEPWPWVYYALILSQLYLLTPGLTSRYGVDRWLRRSKVGRNARDS